MWGERPFVCVAALWYFSVTTCMFLFHICLYANVVHFLRICILYSLCMYLGTFFFSFYIVCDEISGVVLVSHFLDRFSCICRESCVFAEKRDYL